VAKNLDSERTGLYTKELLAEFESLPPNGNWLPEIEAISARLKSKFEGLRNQGLAEQTPTILWHRDWSGNDLSSSFGQMPIAPVLETTKILSKMPKNTMPYSDIKLQSPQIIQLRNVFVACPCIKDSNRRRIIYEELLQLYPHISIQETDLNTWVMNLIRRCQLYPNALETLIELMKPMVKKRESDSMEAVEKAIQRIFINTSNSISGENLQSPELERPEIRIAETRNLLSTWKKIHTLCEKLVKDYIIGVYRYVVGEENLIAKENIRVFRQNCEVFDSNLGRLDQAIFFYWPIRSLRNITPCIGDLLNAMESPPNSTSFIVRKELADSIHQQLFEALSLADRVLQDYFDQLDNHLEDI
jgi:hypothetical protein